MDLIIAFLASMSGALVGASIGVFLLSQRLRPGNSAELDALRGKLQSTEFSLNTATARVENLQKQLVEQEHTYQQSGEVLAEKQRQLDLAAAHLEKEVARRTAAEQRIEELLHETAALGEQHPEVEPKASEEDRQAAEEARRQLASYETQLEANAEQIRQLTEQAADLTADSAELRRRWEQGTRDRSSLEEQLSAGKQQSQELSAQVAELRQHWEQETRDRSSLEAQLSAEKQQAEELSAQVSELESRLSQTDLQLQQERQSTAKGRELLVAAQENLSRLFQAAGVEAPARHNGHAAAQPGTCSDGAAEELQSV